MLPDLPTNEPSRLHQLRRLTRCTHRRSKRSWYNTESLDHMDCKSSLALKYCVLHPSHELFEVKKKIRKAQGTCKCSTSILGVPAVTSPLTARLNTGEVCERRAHFIAAHRRTIHKTTKEKGGFAALPPPCLWNAWRPKLSTGNCSSCFCPSPLWPSNALGTIYGNTWYNHPQGHRRRLSK